MLTRAEVVAGERVLVTGASGGVGLALVQLAAARGCTVVAVTTEDRAYAVGAAGAEHVVRRERDDVPGQVLRLVDEFDVIADVVGGPGFTALLPLLRQAGRVVIAGAVAGAVVELDVRTLYLRQRRLIGSSMHTRAHFRELAALARTGAVFPHVAATFPLERIHTAQERFAAGGDVGKLVITPGCPPPRPPRRPSG